MHLKRAWKPVALAAVFMASSLSYSCKKFDPREYLDRKPVAEDTATFGKGKFVEIGKRAFADAKPMVDTIKNDTATAIPLKPRPIVSTPGSD